MVVNDLKICVMSNKSKYRLCFKYKSWTCEKQFNFLDSVIDSGRVRTQEVHYVDLTCLAAAKICNAEGLRHMDQRSCKLIRHLGSSKKSYKPGKQKAVLGYPDTLAQGLPGWSGPSGTRGHRLKQ